MNEPHIPKNERDWDSIDIFVFSNGEQYSPPRKYHLQADDLKWWEATKSFLARSQYGSKHSAIELYLLDGKKIEAPLELRNSAAYVAVEPPDTFIAAGYEKYLFKASRSWEKRQEKLSNSYVVEATDKTGTFLDITTLEQIERIVSLKSDSSLADPTNIIDQPKQETEITVENPTFSKLNSAKIDKLFQKKKSIGNERSPILNKKHLSPSKINKNDFFKTKNILKPQKSCNKQQIIPPKYSRNQKKPFRENKVECKANPKRNTFQGLENVNNAKLAPTTSANTNVVKDNTENFPNKDLNAKVYKNNEYEEQSIILESKTNKNQIDRSSSPTVLDKINKDNEINDIMVPRVWKIDKTTSNIIIDEQVHQLSPDNNKQNLNIKLRIKLEDIGHSMASDDGNNLEKDRSIVALIKKEMASQVNIDVILGKDILTLNNYLFLNGKSKESEIIKNEEYIPSNDDDKQIFVHYMCDNFIPKPCNLNDSCRKNVAILPTEINKYPFRSCKCNQEKVEMVNKGIQKSLSSSSIIGLNSTKFDNGNINESSKHKVSILREIPKENKSILQYEFNDEVNTVGSNVPLMIAKTYDEKSTQTEWCNVVLQAKSHEEGRYTFHLPALSMLKQYNID